MNLFVFTIKVKRLVKNLEHLQGTTVSKVMVSLEHCATEAGYCATNSEQLPPPKKIKSFLRVLRRGKGQETDCQTIWRQLEDAEFSKNVLFPKVKEDYPTTNKEKPWLIVFASQGLLKDLNQNIYHRN